MARLREILQWQELSGNPVTVGDISITPQSRVLTVRSRFGGIVWNRPTGILVERGGEIKRLPVVDVTRTVLLALLGVSLLVTIFGRSIRERSHSNERRV
jgi:hypothetical protein